MRQPKTDLDQKPEYAVDDSVKRTRLHKLYRRLWHIDRSAHLVIMQAYLEQVSQPPGC